MSKVRTLRDEEQFREYVSRPELVVFIFTATWCGPCAQIADDLDRLASHYHPNVLFVKIDADDHPDILNKCQVAVLPTFMFVRDSAQVGHHIGADINDLKDELKLLTTPFELPLMTK